MEMKFNWDGFTEEYFVDYCAQMENNQVYDGNFIGCVTVGDLCLMKIDSDLRNSRRKFFQDETENHINAVDIHVLEKKGFRNLGTRTKVLTREPTFGE